MEAGSAATPRSRLNWRLWAVVPVLLLALAVGAVVTAGSSLVDLVGSNPPPADQFDIRRVEFSPGEIRIHVRNPQRDPSTIASVSVDDAIVPYTLDGPRKVGRLRAAPDEVDDAVAERDEERHGERETDERDECPEPPGEPPGRLDARLHQPSSTWK